MLDVAVSPALTVLAGPFVGLKLASGSSWGGMSARLAGTYEVEIHSLIHRVLMERPDVVIDVGAAEGYYSLGFARALPDAQVFSYDIDPAARRVSAAGAAENGLANIDVRGRIDPPELQRQTTPGAFVLVDCEGYERQLLDPVTVPALQSASMLVELHEFASPGLTEDLLGRFRETHSVNLIDARRRTALDGAHLTHLSVADRARAVDEGRIWEPRPQQWAYFVPLR